MNFPKNSNYIKEIIKFMQKNSLKSEKGLTLIALVVMIIVLMLLAGVSTYVVLTGNEESNPTPITNNVNEVQEV